MHWTRWRSKRVKNLLLLSVHFLMTFLLFDLFLLPFFNKKHNIFIPASWKYREGSRLIKISPVCVGDVEETTWPVYGSSWMVMKWSSKLKNPFFLAGLSTRSDNKWSYFWKWSLDEVYRLPSVWRVSCQQEHLQYCHLLVFQLLEKYLEYTTASGKDREICSHLSALLRERLLRLWGRRLLRNFMKLLSELARLSSNFEVTDFHRI